MSQVCIYLLSEMVSFYMIYFYKGYYIIVDKSKVFLFCMFCRTIF